MNRIIAEGIYRAVYAKVVVTLENGELIVEVSGEVDHDAQKHLMDLIKDAPPMGGTYWPPPNTLLAAYNVLENCWDRFFYPFMKQPVTVEGTLEEIPFEKDTVY